MSSQYRQCRGHGFMKSQIPTRALHGIRPLHAPPFAGNGQIGHGSPSRPSRLVQGLLVREARRTSLPACQAIWTCGYRLWKESGGRLILHGHFLFSVPVAVYCDWWRLSSTPCGCGTSSIGEDGSTRLVQGRTAASQVGSVVGFLDFSGFLHAPSACASLPRLYPFPAVLKPLKSSSPRMPSVLRDDRAVDAPIDSTRVITIVTKQ